MDSDFLTRLITPSPIMHWLLELFPLVVAVGGLAGIRRRNPGSARLAALAVLLALWFFLPLGFADPIAQKISVMASVIGWFTLLGAWAAHVWNRWPNPVWAHAWVISHLSTILVACIVALYRALSAG